VSEDPKGPGGSSPPEERLPRAVGVELVQDISAISSPLDGFLRRHRHRVKTLLSDGTRTDTYVVDYIDRSGGTRDAMAVAPFARDPSGAIERTQVLLRRQVRYAAYLIAGEPLTTELIAGVIEEGERPEECVVRELYEEAGLEVELAKVRRLGLPYFVLPGTLTERLVPMAVELDPSALRQAVDIDPYGDGSPFEEGAEAVVLTLGEVFDLIARGPASEKGALSISDSKTELILGRLWRALERGALG
jgi:8-oxo-dGTP pyrophosphatase MutT (NUDIX family)